MSHDHEHEQIDPGLAAAAFSGCEEARLLMTRRALLGVGVGLFSAAVLPKTALAGSSTDPRLLLVILRGGMDGLDTLVPVGDDDYSGVNGNTGVRGKMTLDPADLLPLANNSTFMLNPALQNLQAMWADGEATFVPATCVPLRTRSHFDCQDNLENGMPGLATSTTGWLNRALSVLESTHPVRAGGALSVAEAPIVLRGPVPTMGWSLNWLQGPGEATIDRVQSLYKAKDPAMYGMLSRGLKAHDIATQAGGQDKTEAEIPESQMSRLRKGFRGAARLLKADKGPRIAVITVDNFDTHGRQGSLPNPAGDAQLYGRLSELDSGIGDFKSLVGPDAWANTVVLAVSEFGRKVSPNGSLGTDHGVGGLAILAGGSVVGGIDENLWPGLKKLWGGVDLYPLIDTRAVFKAVLHNHFGIGENALASTVFPSSSLVPPLTGIVKEKQFAMLDTPAGISGWRKETGIALYRATHGTAVA